MKTLNGLFFLSLIFLVSGCLPDSFTNWNLAPPSGSSTGAGATPPTGPGGQPLVPPTSFAYTPDGPYLFNLTNDASATIELTPISTGGGQITEGYITFQLIGVTDINNVSISPVWPNSLSMDPNTGIISGKPNQFINHNTYKIKASPLGGTAIYDSITLSMATAPGTLNYPQVNGQTLLLEVTAPQNFKVGNAVTSINNAHGTVTSVDEKNKIIYISVVCTTGTCPIFKVADKIDNKSSYFLEQSTIKKVVYSFLKASPGITNMTPVTNPNISAQAPQFAISPDITVNAGISFNSNTGTISGIPTNPMPNTPYIVTVKNVLGQTANLDLNIQVLDVSNPKSPDSVQYAFKPNDRVVVNLADNSLFRVGGKVANQFGTSATIFNISQNANSKGALLVNIDSFSQGAFQLNQTVDDGYPYVLPATTINKFDPILVHEIGKPFSSTPTLTPILGVNDLNTLSWSTVPELPHLCQSKASTPTVYYIEDTDPACTANNGTCSVPVNPNNETNCINATPTAGIWTTSAKFLTEYKDELWFNRRTGKFGADMPKKTFPAQTFEVTLTSLTGVVLKTNTAISFEDVPKNLSYASDVLLEVDDYADFDIGDQISSDGTGVGVVINKFLSTLVPGTPTYVQTQKILVVRTSSGVFLEGQDIDNVYPFTYQKGEIIKAKYNNLGLVINNIGNFNTGDVVQTSVAPIVKGIVNYVENTANGNPQNIIWVRLIEPQTITSPSTISSFSTLNPTIKNQAGNTAAISGIVADNVTLTQNGATTFAPGMDVASNGSPTGYGMVDAIKINDVSISVERGSFTNGTSLFRFNPTTSTAPGQASAIINSITHNPVFFLDRWSTTGIQLVVDSPANNGVTYAITPDLPAGLAFDTDTGAITTVAPGPVAAALKNYTVVASNYLGQSVFTFGLGVREVFSITDITNTDGNISSILHKSGQGYSRFPCRITKDQIRAPNVASSTDAWSYRAKNINCLYDVGEGELFDEGFQIQVNVGKDLCVYVEHVPYFFYQQQYVKTTTLTQNMEHTGDWANVTCGPGQPTGVPIQYPNGAPASKCVGNQGGVQCDDGSVPTIERDYSLIDVCYNSAVAATGETTLAACYGDPAANGSALPPAVGGNHAYCSNGNTTMNRTACLSANFAWNSKYAFINGACYLIQNQPDVTSCQDNLGTCAPPGPTNRTACTAAGGVWTVTGRWVTNASCSATAGVAGPPYSCGGSQINCINGPAKDFTNFPASSMTNRFGANLRGYTTIVDQTPITFTYQSPLSKGYQTNIFLSNFSRTNSCTPYNGNVYEYNMSTWFNVGKNNSPIANGANQPFSGGNGVYAIRCLDGSANIIGQINILVREWDSNFKAKDGTDLMDFTGNPIDFGGNDEFGYPANTYKDWDNQTTGAPTCPVPTYTYPGANL